MLKAKNTITTLSKIIFLLMLGICQSLTYTHAQQQQYPGSKLERNRQVHLDFHTSETLPDVGSRWNKKDWQKMLQDGNVNSINIFAKGHHGWCYYNTKIGERHPKLKFDLLRAELDACHEIGVAAQAYITVGWDVLDSRQHPDWVSTGKDGVNQFTKMEREAKPGEPFGWGWPTLSPEGPYLELLKAQTKEIATNYEVDGFWFDIVPVGSVNYNRYSIQDMKDHGIDWRDDDAAWAYHCKKMHKFFREVNAIILKYRPNATIYYNWTTPITNKKIMNEEYYQYNTKQDLEDLPTTWAGYDVFPIRSKFYANTGKPIVAMSGKFHSAWGEFGGFKHKKAIWYEAANMMAFGANCNFGDQLHPTGAVEMATYNNIGYAYKQVEKIEDYCLHSKQHARTGIWLSFSGRDNDLCKMLLEGQINFVVANNLKDWNELELLVIHSEIRLNDKEQQQIQKFKDRGGKLLILGDGAFRGNKPLFDIGIDSISPATYRIDYTRVEDALTDDLIQAPFLNRIPAYEVIPQSGVKVLAKIYQPYFDRTVEHWTSHDNVPYQMDPSPYPAVIQKGNTVWCAHPLGKIYGIHGSQVHKQLFLNSLHQLLTKPFVTTQMPSCGRFNLLWQPQHNRYVVNLTYATPVQRGKAKVIDDLVPLYNVPVTIDFPNQKIKSAYLIPGYKPVEMKKENGKIKIIIPSFTCYQGIVLNY